MKAAPFGRLNEALSIGMREHDGCAHDFNVHWMCATTGNPLEGGIVLCPVKGCQCFATWDVPQLGGRREDVYVPDRAAIEELREKLQRD